MKNSDKKIVFFFFSLICFTSFSQNNKFRIIDSLNREVRAIEVQNAKKAEILIKLVDEYSKQENYLEANNANLEALQIYKELGNQKAICKVLVNIGMVYDKQNRFDQGFKYFFEALNVLEKIKQQYEVEDYKLRKGIILMNIGIIYGQVKNTRKSLEVLQAAKQNFSSSQQLHIAICNENIGNAFFDLKENNEALKHFKAALKFFKNNEVEPILIANTYSNIGNIYKSSNNFNAALEQYTLALNVIESKNLYISEKIGVLNSIGDVYIDLDNLEKAKQYLDSSLYLSKENGGNRFIKSNYESLVKLYSKQNDYEKAFVNLQFLKGIEDSFYEPEVLERIARIQKDFDLEVKERDNILKIKLLESEKDIFWYRMYVIIFVILVLLLVMLILYLRQKQKELLNKSKFINVNLEKQQLSNILEFKSNQITNFATYIVRKNEFLETIKKEIDKIIKTSEDPKTIKPLSTLLNQHLTSTRERKDFEILIEKENKDFYYKLDKKYPGLSDKNKNLCSLLLLNLSSKEIATLQNISAGSVEKNRHRLRKKMNIDTSINISEFLNEL